MRHDLRDGDIASISEGSVLGIGVIDCCITDEFEFLLELSERERFFDSSSFVENTHIGKISQGDYMLQTMSKTYIFTEFAINLAMYSLSNYGLYGHIFEYVFQGEVKRYTIFIVLYQFSLLFEETALLQNKLFIETYRLDILLQNGNELQIYFIRYVRVLRNSF